MSLRTAVIPAVQTVTSSVTSGPTSIVFNVTPTHVDSLLLVITASLPLAGSWNVPPTVAGVTDDGGNSWIGLASGGGPGFPSDPRITVQNTYLDRGGLNSIDGTQHSTSTITVALPGVAALTGAIFTEYEGCWDFRSHLLNGVYGGGLEDITQGDEGTLAGGTIATSISGITAPRFESELVFGAVAVSGTSASVALADPLFQDLTTVSGSGFAMGICDYLALQTTPVGTYHTSDTDRQMAFSLTTTGAGAWAACMFAAVLDEANHAIGGADFGLGDGGSGIFG